MKPEEKAKELVDKFRLEILHREYKVDEFMIIPLSIQCALICVEEILKGGFTIFEETLDYWNEVKQQIQKL